MPIIAAPIGADVQFVWNGEVLTRRMNEAVRLSLEMVAAEMVISAQEYVHHPGDSQGYATGELQSDITARVPNRKGNQWSIILGSFNVGHAFWQEVLPEPTGRPYIRPAVSDHIDSILPQIDANYGQLIDGDVAGIFKGYDQVGLTAARGTKGPGRDSASRWQRANNDRYAVAKQGLHVSRTGLGKRGTIPPNPFGRRGH